MAVWRALNAEQLKVKRTLALWLAPLAPLVVVALQMALVLSRREYYKTQDIATAWLDYGGQAVFLWAIMMLPLFVTLETALLAQLEHSNGQWKHLFALPISRSAVYAAKQVSGMGIIGLSMAALYAYVVVTGVALRALTPGLGFEAPVPWWTFFRLIALSYLGSWLILSLHTWVALRWSSFAVAVGVGVAAIVTAVVIFQSDWGSWYPWTLPGLVADGVRRGFDVQLELLASILGGLVVALLGAWDVVRRDVL